MDVKGINWVGHIYHKYETMLLEVEEDIYQDVLNQVQTVGDSVKKFYSDVMQDLIPPPSADSSKALDSDLSIEKNSDVCVCKKIKACTKEEPVNDKASIPMDIPEVIDMKIENHASSFHGLSSVDSSPSDSLIGSCSELYSAAYEDPNMHEIEDQTKYQSFLSVHGPNKIDDSAESSINKNVIDQDSRPHVMVNGDEVHFALPREGTGRPSKKKIRDGLGLRMESGRTQECEQLALWYEGDVGLERLKPVLSMEDKTSSATRHGCESEWELL